MEPALETTGDVSAKIVKLLSFIAEIIGDAELKESFKKVVNTFEEGTKVTKEMRDISKAQVTAEVDPEIHSGKLDWAEFAGVP